MELKKKEDRDNAILHSIYLFLRSKKILIVSALFLFLIGSVFGFAMSGFFGRIDAPLQTTKDIAIKILTNIGISPAEIGGILHENYRIPLNFISSFRSNPERIVIDIKNNDFQKLAYKREIALSDGILISSDDDYVPAKIHYNNQIIDVKLRLKGDWVDHLKGDKWSFRIKIKRNDTLFGMNVFSIQDPITRNYINEWLFQKALENDEIVALRYNFIDVTINGKHKGIYAIEEHFDKKLIEYNEYREGPIINFNEDLLWLGRVTGNSLPETYYSSNIDTFRINKIIDDPDQFEEYIKAKDLLESFRNGRLKTSEVFDANKLAKYMAIIDVMGAEHGTFWHNYRFYYNPVTSRLEPIGFDGNAGQTIAELQSESSEYFQDPLFYALYIKELERISDKSYLDDLLDNLGDDLQSNISIIHKSKPTYYFSNDVFYNNQKFIRNKLNPIKGLQAYFYNNTMNSTITLEIGNIQNLPIEILNVTNKDYQIFEPKNETNILNGMVPSEPVQYKKIEFVLPEGFTWSNQYISDLKLNYRILGHSRLRNETVIPWPHLTEDFPSNDFIRHAPNVKQFDFLVVDDATKMIILRQGQWELNDSLIIPSGYKVMYFGDAPTQLDLRNNATILSYSPLKLFGSEDFPLTITSSDSTGQGIVVLNAGETSILKRVKISNLSAPSKNGWKLSGSVTFYESPVMIENSYLSNNKAGDDLLNIVRSKFEITNSLFKNSLFDALDVDFGKGNISSSVFIDSGNDAMDFSGSQVNINYVNINGTGDKGVSGGEASIININQMEFSECNIAIASKDKSTIKLKDVTVSSCKIGLAAYQKKSEFGPGSISAYSVDMLDVSTHHIIEVDSSLWIDNKEVTDKQEDVYARLEGE